jgi:uncharacterized membrane protein
MTRSQRLLAAFFTFAGVMHFVIPKRYEATVPEYVPMSPKRAVEWSGVAEVAGAIAVIPPATRSLARWWLIALLAAVFPANVHMALNPDRIEGLSKDFPRWLLWVRLPIQPLFVLWVWRATRPAAAHD